MTKTLVLSEGEKWREDCSREEARQHVQGGKEQFQKGDRAKEGVLREPLPSGGS